MQINEQDIQSIVRSVLSEMTSTAPRTASSASAELPKTAKVSMLVGERKMEVKEYPIPAVGDDDILVKVEGCGICGTDVHEWKGDPFGIIPVILGHEGTGEVIALGKNVKCDTAGRPIKIGDKLVTSVINCGVCNNCRVHPDQPQLCENQGIYGLIPHKGDALNGWFSSHMLIGPGSTYFVVNELNLNQRMLLELASVCVHAIARAKTTGLLNFDSKVLLQGCGPVGLMMTAVLKASGINYIIALDGDSKRLEMAKRLGAQKTVNFKETPDLEARIADVKSVSDGVGVDFAFQCTGNPKAAADVYKFIRRGGGLCEMGFFVNNGECTINPHFDLCNKEITLVGSWTYGAHEYLQTIAFLKQAEFMNLPIEDLITHRFPLEKMNEAMEVNVSMQGIKIAYVAE